ncbi:letm1 domain-containing protein 1 [Plakobranchus ocellatus]|uniref:Letm1 domain-containing protein 1 n=1 Tax=Plakobranchus ocellatus TaxID=259542 RepID=A0AAV3ZWZ1_9GAST|nr:letm1 domain-containing protein 1 [Plakobranchus ocellatus]
MAASIRVYASRSCLRPSGLTPGIGFPSYLSLFQTSTNSKYFIPSACCQCHLHPKIKRWYSTEESEDKVKVPSRPRRYALNKLVTILSNSIDKLEQRLPPKVSEVYRTARTGIRAFIADAKEYYRITRQLWSGHGLAEFSRKDLELYRQCSHDLPVMSIALLISLAPGGVLIFPLAYMFPRLLLSHHFWTPQQKQEFLELKMVKQLRHYETLFRLLERKMLGISSEESRLGLQRVVRKLESNQPVSASELTELHHAFEGRPFGTDFLSLRHRACMWRGLNPHGLEAKQKMDYLKEWTTVSSLIHEPSVSLLLHLPVLLSYSHPANRKLLKEIRDKRKS